METKTIPVYKSSSDTLNEGDFFDIKWFDLNIDTFEKIEKPHRHDYFSIYFLTAGETVQFIDFQEYKVQANALIVMRPEQIHFHIKARNAQLLRIKFNEQFLISLPSRNNWHEIFSSDVIVLKESDMVAFRGFIDLIIREYDPKLTNNEILSKLFSALLDKVSLLIKQNDSHKKQRYNSLFKKFKQLVSLYALEEVKVSDYAKKLFISAGHLNDVIKEVTGKNAKTIINEQRILEAKRLLFWTNTSIREIAYKTGFDDPAYFTRFFKKYTGMLPSEFQQKGQ